MRTSSRFSGFRVSSVVASLALAAGTLWSACYNPKYGSNADAGMAFRCFASDNPACPAGLVCCSGSTCGENLMPQQEGWCVTPPEPQDMTITPLDYWNFGTKTMYYGGATMDPLLTGVDPDTGQWRCHRDDANPNPTDNEIIRALEPNDLPGIAVSLSNPLMADPPATFMGNPYEICPDKTAPSMPDVDVFRFKLVTAAKVMVEVKYKVAFGDLDVAIFRLAKDPDTMMDTPQRVFSDVTAQENACIEANNLQPGTYFVVVRGTTTPEKPGVYSMNRYNLKVYTTTTGATCMKKDGGV
jgi:hypothetical protein